MQKVNSLRTKDNVTTKVEAVIMQNSGKKRLTSWTFLAHVMDVILLDYTIRQKV
jgi:hypothetical protein